MIPLIFKRPAICLFNPQPQARTIYVYAIYRSCPRLWLRVKHNTVQRTWDKLPACQPVAEFRHCLHKILTSWKLIPRSLNGIGVKQANRGPLGVIFLLGAILSLSNPERAQGVQTGPPESLEVLFWGDNGHHQPAARAQQLIPVLASRGIRVQYSDNSDDLNLDNLKKFHGLILYANTTRIEPAQESALLEYVAQGGGFVPLHCASYCFLNSSPYIDLVGAQFLKHGAETMATKIVAPDHPIMRGFSGFQSFDETYIHTKHNDRNRIILEVREQGGQAEGRSAEPWTWVRTHGSGRVFYTAWGHDHRTWGHPGFHALVERGIRWACGSDQALNQPYLDQEVFAVPEMTTLAGDLVPFEYEDVGPKIPNYPVSERWGVLGQNKSRMQKPLPPSHSIKHFVTPENFHLELFASEPEIQGKPIAMNWDHRGRLWLCETIDYPNELRPPGEGRDRIRICEDTNGDGRADKFTVFAENLSVPTAIEFYRDGAIVHAGVETLFLRDTNGDDRADQRDVLITGWAMNDTHGGVSNFQYGLDNRYWAMQGYNNSRPKFAGGSHPGFRQGPFNFVVDGVQAPAVPSVEFVRSTTNNSWGLGISEEGLVFASTANRAPSFFVPIPNRYYERVRGWSASLIADAIFDTHLFKPITQNVRQVDHHGGYTAGAGHALYTARNYPQSWWNRVAFVCGPTGHLVGTFVLRREGATYRDTNPFNLLASDDEWSAPIMAEVGPDGNVWVIDWYNFIVQHNPTPQGFSTGQGNAYETDLRDKKHGRIYRVVYDGPDAGHAPSPDLSSENAAGLVTALSHPNRLWRRHAQRLLVEHNHRDVIGQLLRLVKEPSMDAAGLNVGAIHALWTLKGIGAINEQAKDVMQAISAALRHQSAGVRRNAVLVLPPSEHSISAIENAGILADSNLQVRLAAFLALADMPENAQAGELLARAAHVPENVADRWLKEAIICAGASHASSFLAGLLGANLQSSTSTAGGEVAVPTGRIEIATVLAEHLARGKPNTQQLTQLLSKARAAHPTIAQAVIRGLALGWPRDYQPEMTQILEAELDQLVVQLPISARGQLVQLAGNWGSDKLKKYAAEIKRDLMESVTNASLSEQQRIAAAQNVIDISPNDAEVVSQLVQQVTPQLSPAVASGIIRALSASRATNLARTLVSSWGRLTPSMRADAMTVLLARPESTAHMMEAVSQGFLTISDLSLDQRQTLRTHPDRDIRTAANRMLANTGGLPNADRQKVIDEFRSATLATGNPTLGKQIFVKNCGNCHRHSGEGQEIGPDLTGMAVHPKAELLIHILDPSRSVEGNFRRYTVLTNDGKVIAGMLAAESLTAIELIDGEGKRHSISRVDVEQLSSTNKSVMPEGIETQIKQPDMVDLLEFLTSKGRFVPLPLGSVATAVSTKGLFHDGDNGPDRMVFDDWKPKVFGGVPFHVIDPIGKSRPNIVLLNGPNGSLPPKMPRSVTLPCNMVLKSLHMLSGVSGWGHPASRAGSTSLIVRFHYMDGQTEDHELRNGVHFADYIRRIDVPESQFAFRLRGQQIRYLAVSPKQRTVVRDIELLKGNDSSAPIVMSMTAEQFQ